MLKLDVSAWNIALRTTAIYLVALVGLRLAGKREIGQMTVFDLVMLPLIANAVQNAMVGPDASLTGGVLAAVVLLVLNTVLARLRLRWPRLRQPAKGPPTLLAKHLHREEPFLACAFFDPGETCRWSNWTCCFVIPGVSCHAI